MPTRTRDGQIRFHVEVEELPLSSPIQLLLYQIAREAVQNAVKHANPSNVWILEEIGDEFILVLRDDGAGFDTSTTAPDGHFGLSIMRESANLGGGELALVSSPGAGTQVQVTFHRSWLQSEDGQESSDRAVSF